ncbi:MAG: patatin-like phospholipase family protein [Pseudomonadota bacterium]
MSLSLNPNLGVALGAGGARGWCHIGVLRALEARGMAPDVVAGTSMGAVVGAIYAAGKLDALEDWARGLTRQSYLRLMDVRLTNGGIIEGGAIERVFGELDMPARIEDLDVPFAAVACNMATGAEVVFDSGPIGPVVRASAALPGVLSPALIDNTWYLDGGLVNPVPVSAARRLGASRVIGVDPNAHIDGVIWHPPEDAGWPALLSGWRGRLPEVFGLGGAEDDDPPAPRGPGYAAVINATIEIMMEGITRGRLAEDPADLLLSADLAGIMSVMEFDRAAEAIENGHSLVAAHEDALVALLTPVA